MSTSVIPNQMTTKQGNSAGFADHSLHWGTVMMCGWPGLARLWYRGHWGSLVIAIGFAILLNLALISTFLWPDKLGENFPWIAWPMILLVWIASVRVSLHSLPDLLAVGKAYGNKAPLTDTLFNQAQNEYLKGHWSEAESLLDRRLDREPRDVEARLLLATLLRHSRRLHEATDQLDALSGIDQSARWHLEIARERGLIELIADAEADPEDVSHRIDHLDQYESHENQAAGNNGAEIDGAGNIGVNLDESELKPEQNVTIRPV